MTTQLDVEQRERLIRSSRKLGAILGTTPHVLEIDSAPTDSAPSDYIAPLTRTLTLPAPAPSHKPAVTARITSFVRPRRPPPLVLVLHPAPSSTSAPLSAPLLPRAPPSPACSTRSARTTRRRRMAKLARTLGAHPPAELVFPPARRRGFSASARASPIVFSRPTTAEAARTRPPEADHWIPRSSPRAKGADACDMEGCGGVGRGRGARAARALTGHWHKGDIEMKRVLRALKGR